jgi:hypothetical protein
MEDYHYNSLEISTEGPDWDDDNYELAEFDYDTDEWLSVNEPLNVYVGNSVWLKWHVHDWGSNVNHWMIDAVCVVCDGTSVIFEEDCDDEDDNGWPDDWNHNDEGTSSIEVTSLGNIKSMFE